MQRATMLEILTWAYRDELPKRDVQGYGESWVPGKGPRYDGPAPVRLPVALGAPHPDAELVDARVKALPVFLFLRDGRDVAQETAALALHLLGHVAGVIDMTAARLAVARGLDLRPYVQSLALGVIKPPRRETWSVEPLRMRGGAVALEDVQWRTERVRIAGKSAFTRVMVSGRSQVRYVPDPLAVFLDRLRWAALAQVVDDLAVGLAGALLLWRIQGSGLAVEPWRGDVNRVLAGRLLPNVTGFGMVRAPAAAAVKGKSGGRGRPRKRLLVPPAAPVPSYSG